MNNYHIPVLLQEVLQYLSVEPGKRYIDATLGGGGHTQAIIERGGTVLGIDVDQDALNFAQEKIKDQLLLSQGNFQNIDTIAKEKGFTNVDGVLLDLGVSSHQLDEPSRGFSFREGPLDMRMDQDLSVKASDLVNGLTEKELVELFTILGEERFAKKIAKVIVERRKTSLFTSTFDLAETIRQSVFRSEHDIHPATRVFQALRIAVNDELNVLRDVLPKTLELLTSKGRVVVVSFHSLEDRIIKKAFQEFEKEGKGIILTPKPILASEEEVLQNRRARSAKLRVFEKK